MGVHRFYGKAIRLNGFTDGLVVPTGLHKERGVVLNRPQYTLNTTTEHSNATKTGRLHIPNETNPLNALRGSFTLDAYVIPDYGGTVLSKDGQFSLKVGTPFGHTQAGGTSAGPISFTVISGGNSYTVETSFNIDTYMPANMHTYPSGLFKPQDYTHNKQPLMMVTAQFTTTEMKLFLNTALVAELSFGGEEILMDQKSSDLFIGGKGGEYRGLIEAVRINRGIISPKLDPLMVLDETIGMWDFNDEIDIQNHRFFNNARSGNASQGRDGPDTNDGLFDEPLVFIGYDFANFASTTSELGLGVLHVRDMPENASLVKDTYSALEKIASLFTGIPLEEIKEQSWYQNQMVISHGTTVEVVSESQFLDYMLEGGAFSGVPQSSLNLIINHSGTHPDSKYHKGATGVTRRPWTDPSSLPANEQYLVEYIQAKGIDTDLDPMVNPIERVRVIGIDFQNDRLLIVSSQLGNFETGTGIIGAGGIENKPGPKGFLYHHEDDTPVWVCLGNGDLVMDDGNKNVNLTVNPGQKTRPKDAYTRSIFTQGQRFEDRSGNNNEAFWISIQSRSPKTIPSNLNAVKKESGVPTGHVAYAVSGPDPPKTSLICWHTASHPTTAGVNQVRFKDLTGNAIDFYTDNNAGFWERESSSVLFNGYPCYKVSAGVGTGGKCLVNIDTPTTNKITTSSTDSYTIFLMINPTYEVTNNLRFITSQLSTSLTSLDHNNAANTRTFSNGGGSNVKSGILTQNQTQLYCIRINGVTNKIEEWSGGIKLAAQIADGSILSPIDFNDGIFSLMGNATAIDVALERATTSNMGCFANFRFAEYLIYDKALTDIEMAEVNGYFLDKYGVI